MSNMSWYQSHDLRSLMRKVYLSIGRPFAFPYTDIILLLICAKKKKKNVEGEKICFYAGAFLSKARQTVCVSISRGCSFDISRVVSFTKPKSEIE